MKPTYGKTVFFINSYYVCMQGEIEGIQLNEYLLNVGKQYVGIAKKKVFATKNEAIKDKIDELERMLEEAKDYRTKYPNAQPQAVIRFEDALNFYPDTITFLKSQLEEAQEGF